MSEERTFCVVSHVTEEGSRRHVLSYASGSGQTKTICSEKNCEVNLPGGFPGMLSIQKTGAPHEHTYDHGVCWCGHDRNALADTIKNASGEFDKAMAFHAAKTTPPAGPHITETVCQRNDGDGKHDWESRTPRHLQCRWCHAICPVVPVASRQECRHPDACAWPHCTCPSAAAVDKLPKSQGSPVDKSANSQHEPPAAQNSVLQDVMLWIGVRQKEMPTPLLLSVRAILDRRPAPPAAQDALGMSHEEICDALERRADPIAREAAVRIAYLIAQDGLLSDAQGEVQSLTEQLVEMQRPLDSQMATLNARVIELNAQVAALTREKEATPCCGEWFTCQRPCNPRADRWKEAYQAENSTAHFLGAELDRVKVVLTAELTQAITETKAAESRVATMERDAERYRWLRAQHEGQTDPMLKDADGLPMPQEPTAIAFTVFEPAPFGDESLVPVGCIPGELDAAIDAARRETK